MEKREDPMETTEAEVKAREQVEADQATESQVELESFSAKEMIQSQETIAQLQKELKEFKDKYFLSLAEFENFRKRQEKDSHSRIEYREKELILDFLKPMDQLNRALSVAENMSDEVRNWAIGFQMIYQQFVDILNAKGIKKFESSGKPFDPNCHEAVEMIDSDDHPEGVVVGVLEEGYSWKERLLRPAKVKVSKAPERQVDSEEAASEE